MKFLKYLGISIAAIIVLFLISFAITLASSESTEENIELERITITEPTKSFMEVELKSPGKDPYIVGKCNFPDSTDLSISIIEDNSVIGFGGAKTEYGRFIFSFREDIVNSDSLFVLCTKHEKFHSPNVLNQLKLIDSEDVQIEKRFSMLDLKRKFYQKLFEYDEPQSLDMNTVKIEDWTQKDWRRTNYIIKPIIKYNKSEVINQMKHLIINELVKDPTITAVRVEYDCDSTYSKAIFAPMGEWTTRDFARYTDYKLIIKDVY